MANLAGGTLNRTTSSGTATLAPPLSNAGGLNVNTGTLNAAVTQTAGTTTVGATLGWSLAAQGGTVTGGGDDYGPAQQHRRDRAARHLTRDARGRQLHAGAGGTLRVDVNGTSPGSGFDVLDVTGAANVGGTVAVVQGFDPQVGDAFPFLTAASVNGTFSALTGGSLSGGRAFALDYPSSGDVARLVVGGPPPPVNSSPPQVSGDARRSARRSPASPAPGRNNPAFAFQWLLDGQPIPARTTRPTPAAGDAGHQLSCRVTASERGRASPPANSPQARCDNRAGPPQPAGAHPDGDAGAHRAAPSSQARPPADRGRGAASNASTPKRVAAAFGLPSARRCVSRRNFVIRLQPPARRAHRERPGAGCNNKRRTHRRVRGRFTARVDLRGCPQGPIHGPDPNQDRERTHDRRSASLPHLRAGVDELDRSDGRPLGAGWRDSRRRRAEKGAWHGCLPALG